MSRTIPSAIPAEIAERMYDNESASDARLRELAHEKHVAEYAERVLKDPKWWSDWLEGIDADRKITTALAAIWRDYGSKEAVQAHVRELMREAENVARYEAEDKECPLSE